MIHIFHMLHWFLFQSTAQAPFLGVVSPWLDRCEEIGFTASLKSPKWNGLMPGVHRWYWKIHWNKIFEKAHGDFQNLPGRSERNAEAMLGGCIVILNDQEYPETWTPGIILLHQLKNKFNDHSRKPTAYGVDFDTRKHVQRTSQYHTLDVEALWLPNSVGRWPWSWSSLASDEIRTVRSVPCGLPWFSKGWDEMWPA